MIVIPAIDLKEGACVRLRQGEMDDATVFGDDPVAMAGRWINAGCRRLHLVDLNGAFAGKPINASAVRDIAAQYPETPIQIGGGIRDLKTIETYLSIGVSWVIIGTKAVTEPAFVKKACQAFSGHIMVGIDARNGRVATEGWANVTDVQAGDLAQQFEQDGVSSIVYTDIARDGMMQGVNIASTLALASNLSIPVIASGGVTDMKDIKALKAAAHHGIEGAITGRAIYEGTLNLLEAQTYCDD